MYLALILEEWCLQVKVNKLAYLALVLEENFWVAVGSLWSEHWQV